MQGLLMVDGGRAIECLLAKLKVGLWVGGHWWHGCWRRRFGGTHRHAWWPRQLFVESVGERDWCMEDIEEACGGCGRVTSNPLDTKSMITVTWFAHGDGERGNVGGCMEALNTTHSGGM